MTQARLKLDIRGIEYTASIEVSNVTRDEESRCSPLSSPRSPGRDGGQSEDEAYETPLTTPGSSPVKRVFDEYDASPLQRKPYQLDGVQSDD